MTNMTSIAIMTFLEALQFPILIGHISCHYCCGVTRERSKIVVLLLFWGVGACYDVLLEKEVR